MKKKLLTLMAIGFISLTACGESKNPDRKIYYLLVKGEYVKTTQSSGKETKYTDNILAFDIKDKEILYTFDDHTLGVRRYALFFIDGSASLYEHAKNDYYDIYRINRYSYQITLVESCDYSIVDNAFVGRRFTNEKGYLANSYTLYFESGRVVAKDKDGEEIEQFVTESYAKSHKIKIIKPPKKQED